eukprot:7377690-Prymnesium_polylepis.1
MVGMSDIGTQLAQGPCAVGMATMGRDAQRRVAIDDKVDVGAPLTQRAHTVGLAFPHCRKQRRDTIAHQGGAGLTDHPDAVCISLTDSGQHVHPVWSAWSVLHETERGVRLSRTTTSAESHMRDGVLTGVLPYG